MSEKKGFMTEVEHNRIEKKNSSACARGRHMRVRLRFSLCVGLTLSLGLSLNCSDWTVILLDCMDRTTRNNARDALRNWNLNKTQFTNSDIQEGHYKISVFLFGNILYQNKLLYGFLWHYNLLCDEITIQFISTNVIYPKLYFGDHVNVQNTTNIWLNGVPNAVLCFQISHF